MYLKIISTLAFTFNLLFCIGQTKKHNNNNENWQPDLDKLNKYTKQHYNQTFEVKDGMILKYPKEGKSEFKIRDYYGIMKFPEFNSVFATRKNESECVYAYYKYKQNDNLAFGIQCNSGEEMDSVFILFSNFWQELTGFESKINYTNTQLFRIQYIENRKITIVSFPKNEPYKKNLKKHAKDSIYTIGLFLNNDMETYRGYLDMDGNLCHVDNIKISNIMNDTLSAKSIVRKYNSDIAIAKISIQEEVLLEDKKLAKELEEYNKSMLMYVKDCEKDKNFHKSVPYGRSTPCDNIVLYNKMFISAIDRFLEKYEKYITPESKAHLIKQKKQAEINIDNTKLK